MRRALLLVLVFALAACTTSTGTSTSPSPDPTATATVAPTTTEAGPGDVSTTTTEVPTTQPELVTPTGIEDLPADVQGVIIDLVRTTERLRGLSFLEPPVITVVSDEELADRVRQSIEDETENIDADESLYALLGLVPADVDLLALYGNLYGEQVGGFYDGEVGELVVPSDESLSGLQRLTLVHELTHALTDQHFGMFESYGDLVDEQRFDEATAFLSLIEGDATLTEILYLQELPTDEQRAVISESLEADTTTLQQTPLFIRESLVFPYTAGFEFTQRLYELGGFSEIGRAYSQPPLSSEQIIEPRDFRRDLPQDVPAPVSELDGYELVYDSVWGELGWELMLEQILGDTVAREAAGGWGGDHYVYFFDGVEGALVIEYRGDIERDVDELQSALIDYVVQAMAVGPQETAGDALVFSGEDFAAVTRSGESLTFVAATDPAVGQEPARPLNPPGPPPRRVVRWRDDTGAAVHAARHALGAPCDQLLGSPRRRRCCEPVLLRDHSRILGARHVDPASARCHRNPRRRHGAVDQAVAAATDRRIHGRRLGPWSAARGRFHSASATGSPLATSRVRFSGSTGGRVAGTLFMCATPIGNLGDVTDRLGDVLRSVDVVYAEDTRRTATLLRHLGSDRPLRSYFVGNENYRSGEIAARLAEGERVALVTDAGMPAIADPGVSAITAAREVGAVVTVVPGPSAVTSAVALSGFGGDRFVFEGFLPRKGRDRRDRLTSIVTDARPTVLFCSPKRVVDDLAEIEAETGPDRQVCVCRELTKQYEEVWVGAIRDAVRHWRSTQPRGEFTVVLSGAPTVADLSLEEAIAMAREFVAGGMSKSEAAKTAARDSAFPKGDIYDALL